MKTYKKKPINITIEAIQWKGNNYKEIINHISNGIKQKLKITFCFNFSNSRKKNNDIGIHVEFPIKMDGNPFDSLFISKSEWIVINRTTNEYSVLGNEGFKSTYEENSD